MLAHAGFAATAQSAGAKRSALPGWTDPADDFAAADDDEPSRETGEARAAQVAAFIRAAGGE